MRRFHSALLTATLVLTACGSDGSTSPTTAPIIETRLSAAAAAPTATITAAQLDIPLQVTNSLTEQVSGNVCATTVLARLSSGSAWSNVTSETAVCSALAVIVAPGATATFRGVADPAKVRTVAGGSAGTVVFRVQHQLAGDSKNYTLQSNDVTWTIK